MTIREQLNARGLVGEDLDSLIDLLLGYAADEFELGLSGLTVQQRYEYITGIYGHDLSRLVNCLYVIGKSRAVA